MASNLSEGSPPSIASPGWVEIPFVVEANYAGWRLDVYLQQKLARLPRPRLMRVIRLGLRSEIPLKASTPVWPGLRFTVRRPVSEEPPTPVGFEEVFCDDWILVLDKPAGLPLHPSARYHLGTLVGLLRARYGEDFAEPAHRLDRETSGLVLCGRTAESNRRLMRAFVGGHVEKEYLAICEGHPEQDVFTVDAPIATGTELVRIAVRIDAQEGRAAVTDFEVLDRFTRNGAPLSLVRARPKTGRQHQIRIHLQHVGHPLVGDKMYGPDPGYFDRFSRHCLEPEAWERLRLSRHALHAAAVTLAHPGSGERVRFESPLPEDLADFLRERDPQPGERGSRDG